MPRANKLRIAGPRALPRKTTEREKALVTIEVIRQWNERAEEQYAGGGDAVDFAKWLAGKASVWFDGAGSAEKQKERLALLRRMRQTLVEWVRPERKGGRCRRAPRVAALWTLLDALETIYALMCGPQRATDLLWTKYLPEKVQIRVLQGAPFGGGVAEYLHWVIRAATSEAEDEILYVISSRKHQKWYAGIHERWRAASGQQLPGHAERRSEHVEGMVHPGAPRNISGAKYRLWKPYDIWDQCIFPVWGGAPDKVKKVEAYVIAVDQPPANRRGKRMSFEGDGWKERLRKELEARRPPRWRRR